jgi:hypothetical protein
MARLGVAVDRLRSMMITERTGECEISSWQLIAKKKKKASMIDFSVEIG